MGPHPQLEKAKVGYLLSNRDENVDLTCLLEQLLVGMEVPKHIHENSKASMGIVAFLSYFIYINPEQYVKRSHP